MHSKSYVSRKAKTSYNLEWREYIRICNLRNGFWRGKIVAFTGWLRDLQQNCSAQFSELLMNFFFSSQVITKIAGWNVALGICL